MTETDHSIRLAAFKWLQQLNEIHGDLIPRFQLERGFNFGDELILLVSPQGIFKPRILDFPLSTTTAPNSPYDDSFGPDGLLRYRYRGTDPQHRDNCGLRSLLLGGRPLVYSTVLYLEDTYQSGRFLLSGMNHPLSRLLLLWTIRHPYIALARVSQRICLPVKFT